jgi:imidazolonepropionase-like amidohydrolase
MRRIGVPIFVLATTLLAAAKSAQVPTANSNSIQSAPAASTTEQGDFVLHFLQHAIGNEHYELTKKTDGTRELRASSEYTDRGTKVALNATLDMEDDYTPIHYEVKGKSYRYFNVDSSVDVNGNKASVRLGSEQSEISLPARFFAIDGYAPISVQMMMLRYWKRHGRPAKLMALPAGSDADDVTIKDSGPTQLPTTASATPAKIERFTVNNVVWGREALWLDASDNLTAATTYTGGLAFEAVRKEYEPAFAQVIRDEVADRIGDLATISAGVPPVASDDYAITGATLVDGTGRAAIADSVVIVRNGNISAAGPRASVVIPKGMRVIDARGLALLPGLWEMHAHYAQIEWGPAYLAEGVTTARDCGNEFEFVTAVRDAINRDGLLGPRLLLAGLIDGAGPEAFGVNWATTPDEGRALVHKYKDAGFQQIKIYNLVAPNVLHAITAEAHKLGTTVTGHIPNGMNAYDAVNAGMDQINHLGYAMDVMRPAARGAPFDINSLEVAKAIQFYKEHGTVIDPTISWNELLGRPADVAITSFEPGFSRLPYQLSSLIGTAAGAGDAARWRASTHQSEQVVKALYDAGIPIVPGTDKGVPGFSLHRELELYVEAGLTPMQAIQVATIGSARVMGLDRKVGTIEPGKRADFILVRGNPLEDFSALRNVVRVATAGRLYDTDPLWRSVGFKTAANQTSADL